MPARRLDHPPAELASGRAMAHLVGMCGRYTLTKPVDELARVFGFPERPNLPPRYNVAPTQPVPVVRLSAGEDGAPGRHLALLRWGLVPHWAEDVSIGNRMINARGESLLEKASFREAARRRRCLVLADGFYEWKQEGGRKQPYRIVMRDRGPFALAGLWERWRGPKGAPLDQPLETVTIVTTAANALLRPLHDRMPVILGPEDRDAWLDPARAAEDALALVRPCPDDWLELYPVDPRVNSVRNEDEGCIRPLAEDPPRLL
ncbi:SOS response-associated peptidase [Arenibaculum pallidiluteum]|uniref:SOS response-associated peptidase n=1 Tax=Arenibaculum pallidiluteum TaxID=2812559 RepID=UPI001F35B20D|nr:SOS response-associated peptidase [Arenibaculum pallidiluteum]